jgi:3-hydroxyisobutyrate dehydrogenase
MAQIGFIGLGKVGLPMAVNLIKAGHIVTGCDFGSDSSDRLAAAGGVVATALDMTCMGADAIVTVLPGGKEMREVYLASGGVLASARQGALLIDATTVEVDTARTVAAAAQVNELAMVDAPVSGGAAEAEAGTLTFMVGGGELAFKRAKPILELMGKTIIHAGGSGDGQAVKICNNTILGVSMIAVVEAFLLAEKLGIDRQRLFDIVSNASGQCWALTSYCPVPGPVPSSPANRDYQSDFTATAMLNDLTLAQHAAKGVGVKAPIGAAAAALYELYADHGGTETDFSGIIRFLRGPETADNRTE